MHIAKCLSKSAVITSIGSIEIKCYLQILFHKLRIFLNYLGVLFRNKKLYPFFWGGGEGETGGGITKAIIKQYTNFLKICETENCIQAWSKNLSPAPSTR